jgi:hypothetical protein
MEMQWRMRSKLPALHLTLPRMTETTAVQAAHATGYTGPAYHEEHRWSDVPEPTTITNTMHDTHQLPLLLQHIMQHKTQIQALIYNILWYEIKTMIKTG